MLQKTSVVVSEVMEFVSSVLRAEIVIWLKPIPVSIAVIPLDKLTPG